MSIITIPKISIQCPPSIVPGATITFCGEAPGWQEVLDREGFVGGSGNVLRKICNASGIDFSKCNRTNVVKNRPPADDFGIFYNQPKKRIDPTKELEWWIQLLQAELNHYKPNLVVALGGESLRALTGKIGITKWRGSILESTLVPGLKVIPELHPAYIMRDNWEWYYLAIRTLKNKVLPESKSPLRVLKAPAYESLTNPTLAQVLEWIEHIRTSHKPWWLDIETRGDTLSCFGLFSDRRPSRTICVPIQDTTGPHWTIEQEAEIWRRLSLAAASNPYFSNQNLVYDLDYLL